MNKKKTFTVALIGADGAGKTTLANKLLAEFPRPVKYLYMGVNIESSNVALPTSRMIAFLKQKLGRTNKRRHPQPPTNGAMAGQKPRKKNAFRAALRFLNRSMEEWYRQYLAWKYKRQGFIVVYDRHFAFDYELSGGQSNETFFDWLHRWCLAKLYPKPDLVLYLDAPAEVLFARKGEATLEYLAARRKAFQQHGEQTQNFITLDATQSIESVQAQAFSAINRIIIK